MFVSRIIIASLLLMSLVASSLASADTVYIRDVIYVPLRGGQSNEHRILHQGIRSGTVLERLETNEDTGFSRVRTSSGLEGWIQNQYLVTEPIARDRLEAMQERLEQLEADYNQANSRLGEEQSTSAENLQQIAALEQDKAALNEELSRITELAADVINIDARNSQLEQEVRDLNQQIDDLTVANASLQDETNQTWYMIGAATILAGLLLGMWFGRSLFGRRDSGWS
ncbi:MAG: TIGR04211 family SH3 domain-containing protein [Pseudomonadales bacterium]